MPTAQHLDPLEANIGAADGKTKIVWSEDMTQAFHNAQNQIMQNKVITLPTPAHMIWVNTDGATSVGGPGATFYVSTQINPNRALAGFYSAKLRPNQQLWLPCEVEALAISAAVKYFSPYIIQ